MKIFPLLLVCAACHVAPASRPDDDPPDAGTPGDDATVEPPHGIDPSNSGDFGFLASTGSSIELPSLETFDTTAECTASSVLGNCSVAPRAGLGEACVCRADHYAIHDLRVVGRRALVLFANVDVLVTGTLDISGHLAEKGPGASFDYPASTMRRTGGAGGSFGSRGGDGVTPSATTVGTEELIPLTGGMNGMSTGGLGGGGGGALQITAGTRIEIAGAINAAGGGGLLGPRSSLTLGGGGGGSGGAILVEAPVVAITGVLVANGGGGAGAQFMESWDDVAVATNGWDDAELAVRGYAIHSTPPGGFGDGALCGATPFYAFDGGNGASSQFAAGPSRGTYMNNCAGSVNLVGGPGAGGGAGRIRINTVDDCECSGTITPASTRGPVRMR